MRAVGARRARGSTEVDGAVLLRARGRRPRAGRSLPEGLLRVRRTVCGDCRGGRSGQRAPCPRTVPGVRTGRLRRADLLPVLARAHAGRAAGGGDRLTAKLAALATVALAVALGGCGGSSGAHTPDLRKLPLADGARAVAQTRVCDRGAS